MTDQTIAVRYDQVVSEMKSTLSHLVRNPKAAQLVAVSKTYFADTIEPVLEKGHRVFGENRVQESLQKWPDLKAKYSGVELHLIGPLQSNKAAEAVSLFDVIETVDRPKTAHAISKEMQKQDKQLDIYIQVNTGLEPQKAGIAPTDVTAFVTECRNELNLNVLGLMCIPPFEENPGPHFALLRELARENGLLKLSMGMSSDYKTALEFGATSVRIGSAIFGARK